MPVTRDQELWALTLSIERKHGDRATDYIAERVATFEQSGPPEAAARRSGVAFKSASSDFPVAAKIDLSYSEQNVNI